jgi:hypothetical protein
MPLAMLLLCMHARFMRQFSMGLAMHATDRIVWFRFVSFWFVLSAACSRLLCPLVPWHLAFHILSLHWSPLECFGPLKVFRASFGVHACICMIDDVMDHLISRNATDAEARAALAFSSSNVLQFQHML